MKPGITLQHKFVESLPDTLQENTLYVCMEFATAAHRYVCGCGREVVTPLSPTDWKLMYDGRTVTLHPSIGNWSFPCRSHYWIRRGRVEWAAAWTDEEIRSGRAQDRRAKEAYFDLLSETQDKQVSKQPAKVAPPKAAPESDTWKKSWKWWKG